MDDRYEPPGEWRAAPPKFVLEPFDDIKCDLDAQWLIKNILPKEGVGAIIGLSQAFKSFVALDALLHVAAGMETWGGQRVKQGSVIYIAAEGAAGVRKRIEGWKSRHKHRPEEVQFHLISAAPNLGTNAEDLKELIRAIRQTGVAPSAIALDTVSQTLGAADENGSGMVQFIANAGALAREFRCLVLAVHHVGYGRDNRPRGHSSFRAALDVELLCSRESGALSTVLAVQKLKDERTGRSLRVDLVPVYLGRDSDGEEISTLVVETVEVAATAASTSRKSAAKADALLMSTAAAILKAHGSDTRPFGDTGPVVRAVCEDALRAAYYTNFKKRKGGDSEPKKLAANQRQAFGRTIKGAISANALADAELDGVRYLWIP